MNTKVVPCLSKEDIKKFIQRHRSIAILIDRDHFSDAVLLLKRLIVDLSENGVTTIILTEAMQNDARALRLLNKKARQEIFSLARQALNGHASTVFQNSKKRRNVAIGSVVALIVLVGTIFGGRFWIQNAKIKKATETLQYLSQVAAVAKIKSGKTLQELTGNNCSFCPCRTGNNLQDVVGDDHCFHNWVVALKAIWRAASDGEFVDEDVAGRLLFPKEFIRDPWGAPYLLHEGEGTTPGTCEEDTLASAGPSGIAGSATEITVKIQSLCTK